MVINDLDPSLRERIKEAQAANADVATLKKTAMEWASTQDDKTAESRVETWCVKAGLGKLSTESAAISGADVESDHGKAKETDSARLNTLIQDRIKRFWLTLERLEETIDEKEYDLD